MGEDLAIKATARIAQLLRLLIHALNLIVQNHDVLSFRPLVNQIEHTISVEVSDFNQWNLLRV